ncbi:glycosyl transferase [Weizmannia acidilactici]|uniref:Glycosyl transferase n=1 Tax=Weizmannia acidilactici TaxID=2607726 RepID=A0A5J4JN17_9BACI|nr:glycoside hydrolase family 99-like domain-containing protein [Weizmannia acidilactici]NWN97483.1 glycoside hydrolase family 99-like domain-containing protein [Bacillus sp. (in: firmicutes)]GER70384.1 glycosyl transferase [Weizmannia acidilactici]
MKIIAFYLPQFHSIPENDKWWGKGFTEWTNTKKALPLYRGHSQPKEPLNDNYYNLLNDDVKKWQIELAKEYGIYGFCYYHYWFNGKKVLEKPLEQVLNNSSLDLPFCISWANEPWTRSWDGKTNEILLAQDYGDKKDWYNHFQYLLQFFKDQRYIKIDNQPLLVIYKVESIPNHKMLFEYWINLARKNGFKGLYIAETLNGLQKNSVSNLSNAIIQFEPNFTIHHDRPLIDKIKNKIKNITLIPSKGSFIYKTMDYDITWKRILKRKINLNDKDVFLGGFVDWDNTARKGKNALVFHGGSPEKFKKYLKLQIKNAKLKYNSDFIFINAWNEWAEGTYLEPDKKYGNSYLKAVKEALEESENLY